MAEKLCELKKKGGGGSSNLIPIGKYRTGYGTDGQIVTMTEYSISGDTINFSVPASNQGFLEINVSNYSQIVLNSSNPVLNIELIGNSISKLYYLAADASATARTLDLSGVELLTIDHRVVSTSKNLGGTLS